MQAGVILVLQVLSDAGRAVPMAVKAWLYSLTFKWIGALTV